jgi:hypothetical protein
MNDCEVEELVLISLCTEPEKILSMQPSACHRRNAR